MLQRFKGIFSFFVFLTISIGLQAQTGNTSPYSRFGLGNLITTPSIRNSGMGGVGIALMDSANYSSLNTINHANPATFSGARFTVLEASVRGRLVNLRTDSLSENKSNVQFGGFAIAFPAWAKKRWGMSIGMLPVSNRGYRISESVSDTVVGTINYHHIGEGGLNQFYWSNAIAYKNLSVGVRFSYLFGSLDQITRIILSEPNTFDVRRTRSATIGDIRFQYGLLYQLKLPKEWGLNLGLTATSATNISGRVINLVETYEEISEIELIKDTVDFSESEKGRIFLPWSVGLGFVLQKSDKLNIGMDFKWQNWSKYSAFGEADSLADSWRLAVGAEYVPLRRKNPNEKGYFKTIHYRLGAYYSQSYLKLDGRQLPDYGITFGFGVPLQKSKENPMHKFVAPPMINFAMELGQRGTLTSDPIRERYINFKVAVTLNDKWFIKRKYD